MKIDSADENDFINKELLADKGRFWIGLADAETENDWKWTDGSKLTGYANWMTGQPNNYSDRQDCALMLKGPFNKKHYDGEWNDLECSKAERYICEK